MKTYTPPAVFTLNGIAYQVHPDDLKRPSNLEAGSVYIRRTSGESGYYEALGNVVVAIAAARSK